MRSRIAGAFVSIGLGAAGAAVTALLGGGAVGAGCATRATGAGAATAFGCSDWADGRAQPRVKASPAANPTLHCRRKFVFIQSLFLLARMHLSYLGPC